MTAGISVSLEAVLWVAVLAAGFALRLARLDHLPLTLGEASRAFEAWRVSNGSVPDGWSGDLTSALTSHLFRVFPDGEITARIIPAIAGSATLLLVWPLRRYLGAGAAFLAVAYLAFSPLAVQASRSVGPFSAGILLSLALLTLLLAYLERPRPALAGGLGLLAGLAAGSDPVSVTALLAGALFLVLEAAWWRNPQVYEARDALLSRPGQWLPAIVAFVAAIVLSISHFGTHVERLSLPGLRLWTEMFNLPHDSWPGYYDFGLLAGYELPALGFGTAAVFVLLRQLRRGPALSPLQRLLLVWTALAALLLALSSRRESGQILILLVPLVLLTATWLQELLDGLDWRVLIRWWPAVILELALLTYAAIELALWARPGGDLGAAEKLSLVAALTIAGALPLLLVIYFGRHLATVGLVTAALVGLSLMLTSAFALAFSHGSDFARDSNPQAGIAQLHDRLAQLSTERQSAATLEPELARQIGWYLRDLPLLSGSPPPDSGIYVTPAQAAPQGVPGFPTLDGTYRVVDIWYPESLKGQSLWRWFAYRQSFGALTPVRVQVYLR
ncbi:MAG TPA: glycosyltransferase family 39 protein [Dehalococcoidia bacterium]|nr:glycosyltransferase family 39 protein [Dehalococcoidia bacterium]